MYTSNLGIVKQGKAALRQTLNTGIQMGASYETVEQALWKKFHSVCDYCCIKSQGHCWCDQPGKGCYLHSAMEGYLRVAKERCPSKTFKNG